MSPTRDMDDGHRALFQSLHAKYELQGTIGQGAMGTVYLAHDRKHDRRVAIKTVQPDFVSKAGRQRFEQEIKVTARLQHPHILPLLDSGIVDDVLYYVMPFVEGESLQERLERDKQLSVDEALRIAREIADALSHAHALDVIHRDIKPSNIMVSGRHAFVMDFGIARAVSETSRGVLTGTGLSMGTPLYMSPEQAVDASAADGRSDVYALGCVLFEMLAGQPPFTGATVEAIVHQHLTVPAPAITNFRPAVPAEVVSILARALAKAPADRFSPAAQFGDALGHPSLRGVQTVAAPWKARNTLLVVIIYLAGSLGLFGIVNRVAENTVLPDWIVPLSLVLLLVGLPLVVVTAVVQAGASRKGGAGQSTAPPEAAATGVFGPPGSEPEPRILALFTWRNVVAGGVLALAFWGVVATSWLIWFQDAQPAVASTQPIVVPERAAEDEAGAADVELAESDEAADVPASSPSEAGRPPATAQPGSGAARAAFGAAQADAVAAKASAEAADVGAVQPQLTAIADSLLEAATDAAAAGDFPAASSLAERASQAFDQVRLTAIATWQERLSAARAPLSALRQTADAGSSSFADGEQLEREATLAEGAADYPTALTSLEAAAEAYRSAERADPAEAEAADPTPTGPEPSAEDRIVGLLTELRAALEGEDVERLRRIWIGLTAGQVAGFESSFDAWDDIRVTLEPQLSTMTVSADAISVVVSQLWTYDGGELRSPPQRFEMAERGGRWVIVDVRANGG